MTKTIEIIRRGIYFPLALLMCCGAVTHVNAIQTDTEVATEETAEKESASNATPEQAEPDEAPKSFKDQFDKITSEFDAAMSAWSEEFKAAKTRAAQSKLIRVIPRLEFAEKFLELYETNTDEKDAYLAVNQALTLGGLKTKTTASQLIYEQIEEQNKKSRESYILLTKFGLSADRIKAAQKLLDLSKEEKDDAIALEMLKPITGSALARSPKLQSEAVALIWNRVEDDLESADFDTLMAIAVKSNSESGLKAMGAVLKHHRDDKGFERMLAVVPRSPNKSFEMAVEEILKTGEGDLQAQAAVSFAKYLKVRDRGLNRDQLSEEKVAALDKENKDLKDLLRTLDGDSELHKQAQDELFILEKLAPGAEAMDIVGTDLYGKDLKLSDYRGKVVFLDFWGDW